MSDLYRGMWNSVPDPSDSYCNETVFQSYSDEKPLTVHELIKYDNGDIYCGFTLNNEPHGDGYMEYSDKKKFNGSFKFGISYTGKGWVRRKNNNWFNGTIKDGYFQKGEFFWSNGSIYKGDYHMCLQHGYGEMKYAKDGITYYGDWHMGDKHGNGTMYWDKDKIKELRSYTGKWVKNKATGKGSGKYDSKGIRGNYQGEYVDFKRHGIGEMDWFYPDNHQFEDDITNYKGEWKNDVITGKGEADYKNYKNYKGMFKNGKKHGYGVLTYWNKHSMSGTWVNGKLKK